MTIGTVWVDFQNTERGFWGRVSTQGLTMVSVTDARFKEVMAGREIPHFRPERLDVLTIQLVTELSKQVKARAPADKRWSLVQLGGCLQRSAQSMSMKQSPLGAFLIFDRKDPAPCIGMAQVFESKELGTVSLHYELLDEAPPCDDEVINGLGSYIASVTGGTDRKLSIQTSRVTQAVRSLFHTIGREVNDIGGSLAAELELDRFTYQKV